MARWLIRTAALTVTGAIVAGATWVWSWSARPDAPNEVWALLNMKARYTGPGAVIFRAGPDGASLPGQWIGAFKCEFDRFPYRVLWVYADVPNTSLRTWLARTLHGTSDQSLDYLPTVEFVETPTGRWHKYVLDAAR